MASSEILSQTLLSITRSKLSQLDKQKEAYETGKRQLQERAAAQTDNGERTRALITGASSLPSMTSLSQNPLISLSNFDRFIQQAQNDPSITDSFILECEASVRKELDVQSSKYDYASLYGKLVNEWTSPEKKHRDNNPVKSASVGREEAQTQRATWEEYVFNPKQTDEATIKTYLAGVFESETAVKETLAEVRRNLEIFQRDDQWSRLFDVSTVRDTVQAMLRTDILTDVKRSTLRDFLGNEVVLSEIADVLNMRLQTRKKWAWKEDLIIDQRRNLNGRYRFYPDEDLLQSIFIYEIGMRWGVKLRECFSLFLDPKVWKPTLEPISEDDEARLRWFMRLDRQSKSYCTIPDLKQKHFEEEIFLDQLPRSLQEQRGSYGSMDEAKAGDSRKSHVDVTQKLLHMIQADILVASGAPASPSSKADAQGKSSLGSSHRSSTTVADRQSPLCKPVTVIRSDFKWFGPSIPHSSITTVLGYFGVNKAWLGFFVKVLEAPLRFKQDAETVPSRTRKRGTPISTPLADVFGESLLFCIDFAVNQKAEGARLYRLHDDMWLWGDMESCKKSWEVLTQCAKILGLEINAEKTGAATTINSQKSSVSATDDSSLPAGSVSTIARDSELKAGLPKGDVTWGFLKLDAGSGRFIINQADVDEHIDELRLQLNACKSIFDWIQAWNIYGVRFFSNFFGKPANCYSRQHIDSVLDTFRRIQQQLFPDTRGGAGEYLRKMIAERFDIPAGQIPDGYIYFPAQLGGLGLKNPFINLCLVRESVPDDPQSVIGNRADEEEKEYRNAKIWFESNKSGATAPSWYRDEPFMSREEYSRHRERMSNPLRRKYEELMREPSPVDVELRGEVKAVVDAAEWDAMSSYDRWVVSLYGREMLAKFGGIHVVEKGLLPMGMMAMLRQSKFQWVG
ncbi:unnamed protein product [Discula destructiva]